MSLELRPTGDYRSPNKYYTVNTATGESFKTWENLHQDLDSQQAAHRHNMRVASRKKLNQEIQAYKNANVEFRATEDLFLHRIKYRSFGTICYIPIPIPILCHVGDYIDVLLNDSGEVFPAFIPSDVLQMNATEIVTKCFCPTPYCHHQIEEFLKANGYAATTENICCECNHKVNFPKYRNYYGMEASCVFSVRCLEVKKFTRANSNSM